MIGPQEQSAAKLTAIKLQRATISQFGRMDVFGGGVLPLVRSLARAQRPPPLAVFSKTAPSRPESSRLDEV